MNSVKSLYLPRIYFSADNLPNQKGRYLKSPEGRFAAGLQEPVRALSPSLLSGPPLTSLWIFLIYRQISSAFLIHRCGKDWDSLCFHRAFSGKGHSQAWTKELNVFGCGMDWGQYWGYRKCGTCQGIGSSPQRRRKTPGDKRSSTSPLWLGVLTCPLSLRE